MYTHTPEPTNLLCRVCETKIQNSTSKQINPYRCVIFYNRFSAPGMVKIYPQAYLEFYAAQKQSSNGYSYVCQVQLFNGVVEDITGSRIIPEIDMAGAVDAFDQEVGYYTCARKTRRWPMRLFFFILNTACLNAFVLWIIKKSGKEAWSMSILSQ